MLIGAFAQYFFGISIFLSSIFLILLVLVQRGRGGGLTGALGGPGGQSAFGTKAGDLFTRITIGVAVVWIFLCASAVIVLRPPALPELDGSKANAGAGSNMGGSQDASAANTSAGSTAAGSTAAGSTAAGSTAAGSTAAGNGDPTMVDSSAGVGTQPAETAPDATAELEDSVPETDQDDNQQTETPPSDSPAEAATEDDATGNG